MMDSAWTALAATAALLWWALLALPWRPWRTTERLEGTGVAASDLNGVTVLIPARNEAATIGRPLAALAGQGPGLRVVVVDDESTDGTGAAAQASGLPDLTVLRSDPLPSGWTGKLWALEQARHRLETPLVLLLDADIALAPGTIDALRTRLRTDHLQLVSLMAAPGLTGLWERLLMPAFVYFFKLLYPFRLANSRSRRVAGAAGGCILMETEWLDRIGGFESIRDELIDDCALARRVKSGGGRTWIGLTHSALMVREHGFHDIWNMVARTAFIQLRYSSLLLGLCTLALLLAFLVPIAGLAAPDGAVRALSAAALAGMILSYVPTLRFYGRAPAWALTLPAIGLLYLLMTWASAVRYWRGDRSRWKNRTYIRLPHEGR